MKKTLLLVACSLISIQGFTQINITGKKPKQELQIGISANDYRNFEDFQYDMVHFNMMSFHVGYNYLLTKRFEIGATAGFNVYKENPPTFPFPPGCGSGTFQAVWNVNKDYAFLLTHIQFNWVNKGLFKVYSGLGGGLKYRNTDHREISESFENDPNDYYTSKEHRNIALAYQANLLGISVGRKLGGFAECGIGDQGYFTLGARYKF